MDSQQPAGHAPGPEEYGSGTQEPDAGHPLARLTGIVPRLPRYIKLGYRLLRDPAVPAGSKGLLGLAVGYAVSPINLIPTIIPVAGQLDDLAALLFALRQALRACPAERAGYHLNQSGLELQTLDNDLRTVRDVGLWVASRPLAWGFRLLSGGLARRDRPANPPPPPGSASTTGATYPPPTIPPGNETGESESPLGTGS